MGAKISQRNAAFVVFGIIAAGYIFNLVIFSLSREAQFTAGGLLLVASGAACLYFSGAPETLSCDRALNTCRLTRPRFLHMPKSVETFPLDRVRAVRVNETYVSSLDGPGHTGYEVSLETEGRRVHVFCTEDRERSADAIARRIRSFLKDDSQRSLMVRRFPWMIDAVGGALIIAGALLVLSAATGWLYAMDV
ncbi:MAG TPA: hypothetical protein VF527_15445 [Pyrinomonadaceae bacterium]|jgi:hypothetical protein